MSTALSVALPTNHKAGATSSPNSSPPSPRYSPQAQAKALGFQKSPHRKNRHSLPVLGIFRKSSKTNQHAHQHTQQHADEHSQSQLPQQHQHQQQQQQQQQQQPQKHLKARAFSSPHPRLDKHVTREELVLSAEDEDEDEIQAPSLLVHAPEDFGTAPTVHAPQEDVPPPPSPPAHQHQTEPDQQNQQQQQQQHQQQQQQQRQYPAQSNPQLSTAEDPPFLNAATNKLEVPRSVSMPLPSLSSPLRKILLNTGQDSPASVFGSSDLGMCCDIFDHLSRRPDIPIPDSFRSPRRTRKQSRTVTTLHFLDAMRTVCSNQHTSHGVRTFLKQTIGRLQLSDAYNTYDDLTFFELIEVLEQSAAMTLVMLCLPPNHATVLLRPLWVECGKNPNRQASPQPVRRVVSVSGASLLSAGLRMHSRQDSSASSGTRPTSGDDEELRFRETVIVSAFDDNNTGEDSDETNRSLPPWANGAAPVQRASSLETTQVHQPPSSPPSQEIPSSVDGIKSLVNTTFGALASEGAQGYAIAHDRLYLVVNHLLGGNPKHTTHLFLVELMQQLEDPRIAPVQLYVGDFTCLVMRATASVRRMSTDETWSPAQCLSMLQSAAYHLHQQPNFRAVHKQTSDTPPLGAKGGLRGSPTSPGHQVKFGLPTVFVRRQNKPNSGENDNV